MKRVIVIASVLPLMKKVATHTHTHTHTHMPNSDNLLPLTGIFLRSLFVFWSINRRVMRGQ